MWAGGPEMKQIFRLLTVTALCGIFSSSTYITIRTRANNPMQAKPQTVAQRVKQLQDLLSEQWEYTLSTSPEFASIIGDKRYNDRLSDFSQAAIDSDLRQASVFLQKFEAIDPTDFPEQ